MGATLAHGFVHDYGSSDGDVERGDAARHGNAQEVVAGALDQIMKPRAFAAEDKADVLAEVEVCVVGGAALVEADDPDVLLLHGLEGAGDVDDLGDADVLAGTGRGFCCHSGERRGSALGEDDSVDASPISRAEQGAEIVRIFHAIQSEKEPVAGGARGCLEKIFKGKEFALTEKGDDPLVGIGAAVPRQLVTGFRRDPHTFGARKREDRLEAGVSASFALAGDTDVVQGAHTRPESLLNGMQAVQNIHTLSVLARGGSVPADEAGGAVIGAQIEGIHIALALQALGGKLASHATLAVEE